MGINVIRWKLNELMARKRIRNKDLAFALGITENSVYRLRRIDEMPRLAPERLNGICAALECQPGELMEWVSDDDGSNQEVEASSASKEPSKQAEESIGTQHTKHRKRTRSLFTIVAESAGVCLRSCIFP